LNGKDRVEAATSAESVLGTNATALTLAVARFKEQWPQIQLDYDPVLLSPKSILPRLGYRFEQQPFSPCRVFARENCQRQFPSLPRFDGQATFICG
jgi:hypothetical protein